jgi:hypothetical protein
MSGWKDRMNAKDRRRNNEYILDVLASEGRDKDDHEERAEISARRSATIVATGGGTASSMTSHAVSFCVVLGSLVIRE